MPPDKGGKVGFDANYDEYRTEGSGLHARNREGVASRLPAKSGGDAASDSIAVDKMSGKKRTDSPSSQFDRSGKKAFAQDGSGEEKDPPELTPSSP